MEGINEENNNEEVRKGEEGRYNLTKAWDEATRIKSLATYLYKKGEKIPSGAYDWGEYQLEMEKWEENKRKIFTNLISELFPNIEIETNWAPTMGPSFICEIPYSSQEEKISLVNNIIKKIKQKVKTVDRPYEEKEYQTWRFSTGYPDKKLTVYDDEDGKLRIVWSSIFEAP